ncbi:PREDICTED: AN1-type zinc finger protein 2A isoform X4 [Ficedula albicollis]|uniref:AN1-type zinc finger protein 2A isoform X4 n=1 Tax=Ficedula albicollis TaxID=59894 RepID=UPI000359BFD7|nr:PREDICTED: AN1-type zinc finger protein 2A isoform X4 [Ficedula albicollis]
MFQNVQVPVCPLCHTPIPVQKGEIPDIVVGAHIDKDCKSNPAQQKIFTNKCVKPGCKRKEMMKLVCEQCGGSFCIKHRHPLDHDCKGSSQPISKAGYAALMRAAHSTFKSPGATGVPSNGNRQHNRYQLHGEKRQTKTGLVSTRCSSATVTPLTALELVADL